MKSQYDLLQDAIKLTPTNDDYSRNCITTVETLAKLIGETDGLTKAQAIFNHFRRDGTTPAKGMIHLPGIEPYPYEPHRIIVSRDGTTYKPLAEATLEYMEAEAERAATQAKWAGFAVNADLN
jgi:hypothetical protein